MPRATDGTFSLPTGTLVTTGEVIQPSQHNPAMQDIATSLTNSLSRDGQGAMRANLSGGGFKGTNFAPGENDTDLATVSQINSSSGVPVGSIVDYAGTSAPDGWLFCAGQGLSRVEYASLFAAIGTQWGAPTGSTFNIPDLRGRVTAGRDIATFVDRLTAIDSRTLGAAGGAQTVTLTTTEMPAHTHAVTGTTNTTGAHTHGINEVSYGDQAPEGAGQPVPTAIAGATGSAGDHSHTVTGTAASTGTGEAHANVQPTIILNKIIKVTA